MIHAPGLIALMSIALLAGCATTMTFEPKPGTQGLPAVTKKVPLHAGVSYSQEFSEYKHVRMSGKHTVVVPIGAASVRYFDELLPRVFAKTSRVADPSSEALSADGIDVVVSVSLEHYDFPLGLAPYSEQYSIAYRATFTTTAGVPIASWVFTGTANHWKMLAAVDGITEAYMRDAAAKFLEACERETSGALAAVAAHRSGKTVPIDASILTLSARRTAITGLDESRAKRLRETGLVPIEVATASNSQRPLTVRASDMRLRLANGQLVFPATASALLEAMSDSYTPSFVPSSHGGLLALGVVAFLATESQSHGERKTVHEATNQTFFRDRSLEPNKTETGIVFFRLPKDAPATEGASLTVWVVDPATADGVRVAVPVRTQH